MKSLTLFLAALLAMPAIAADLTLAWDPSPEPVDGYQVYWASSSGGYNATNRITVIGTNTTVTITNLAPGETYYFTATAFRGDMESEPCNEVVHRFDRRPQPPHTLVIESSRNGDAWIERYRINVRRK